MTETRDERRDRKRAEARGVEQFREHTSVIRHRWQ